MRVGTRSRQFDQREKFRPIQRERATTFQRLRITSNSTRLSGFVHRQVNETDVSWLRRVGGSSL